MNVLAWLRSDFRLADNPALAFASAQGAVLPVVILDPKEWAQPDRSGRHFAFMAETLEGLRREMSQHGLPLIIRTGDPVEVLGRLARHHDIAAMVTAGKAHTPWAIARDLRVKAWSCEVGLPWLSAPKEQLASNGNRLFTPVPDVACGPIPSPRALGIAEDPCPYRLRGGVDLARDLVQAWLARPLIETAPPSPIGGERSSPRLSAHLALGALGTPEIERMMAEAFGPAARRLAQHLGQRAQWAKPLLNEPVPLPAPPPVCGALEAFGSGATGLPFVDALLRALQASGWANPMARSVLAGVGVHFLGLTVQDCGQALARMYLDYDPLIHWPLMSQTAAKRIGNPVALGQVHDPEGAFIRRWLPELSKVPGALIHTPWRWEGAAQVLGRRYPEPLIDPSHALREAKLRWGGAPRRKGVHLSPLQTLASLFENMPPPLPATGPQLRFDL